MPTPFPSSTPLDQKDRRLEHGRCSGDKQCTDDVPGAAEVEIPGYSGVIVETLDGKIVLESNSGLLFNPASNVKVATTYAVLKTFGPEFRFQTMVFTDGAIDRSTGTLNGNVYVSGKDPIFGFEHAVAIANELNRMGISSVSGDLIVTDNFAMNYSGSSLNSAQALYGTLDASKRSAAATRTWLNYLAYSGKYGQVTGVPSVYFSGAMYVQPIPSNLTCSLRTSRHRFARSSRRRCATRTISSPNASAICSAGRTPCRVSCSRMRASRRTNFRSRHRAASATTASRRTR